MPRLFTGIEIPNEIGQILAEMRGGLPGARWIRAPSDYHVTLRFIGDVEPRLADDVAETLATLGAAVAVAFAALACSAAKSPGRSSPGSSRARP